MAEWRKLAKVSEVESGSALAVEVDGREPIAIVNVDGQMYAIDDICTHADASLCDGIVDGEEIECPLHFARFNIKTGAVVAPPADRPLCTYPVRILGDDIEVEL